MNTEQRAMNTKKRINLKFLVRLEKTPSQALEMLKQVYGDNTRPRKGFKKGCKEVENDSRSRRPSTSMNEVNAEQ